MFFFGDVEELRLVQGVVSQPAGSGVLPTACELGQATCNGVTQLGNFSDDPIQQIYGPTTGAAYANNIIPAANLNAISKVYASLLPFLPETTCSNATAGCIFRFSPRQTQNKQSDDVRVDETLGSADTRFERYTINTVAGAYPGAYPPVTFNNTLVYPGGTNGNPWHHKLPGVCRGAVAKRSDR